MRKYVKIVNSRGNSYLVYDRDVYIIYYLVGYKIKDNMLRIPGKCLDKIKILLDKNNINYKAYLRTVFRKSLIHKDLKVKKYVQ